jgi:NADPH-dependent 2,4-dienoyl-CoA reductase/sulfur reductase-like enzyme
VVGGGPAGLEAARVAAERGHHVTLAEAGPELGGAFRLAGLQPRRSQISELIEWYRRELERLDVRVLVNTPLSGDDVAEFHADAVVLATGSQPAGTGFQRQLAMVDTMPGVDARNVWSIDDVMANRANPGHTVVLLDDTGDWRGGGTAWHLAERGHRVVIVTPHPMVGFWIQRTAGDGNLRATLARLGATWLTESAITEWKGDRALVRSLLDGTITEVAADALVLSTTNVADTTVFDELSGRADPVVQVGDAVAPRLAVHAIYEGRVAGMGL